MEDERLCKCVISGGSNTIHRVHLAVAPDIKFDFLLIFFIDLVTKLKNSYLELGESKWGEPNFVRFIMKCTI